LTSTIAHLYILGNIQTVNCGFARFFGIFSLSLQLSYSFRLRPGLEAKPRKRPLSGKRKGAQEDLNSGPLYMRERTESAGGTNATPPSPTSLLIILMTTGSDTEHSAYTVGWDPCHCRARDSRSAHEWEECNSIPSAQDMSHQTRLE